MKEKKKNPAAVALGKMTSAKKAKAARINGKKGGAPRKKNLRHAAALGLETKPLTL